MRRLPILMTLIASFAIATAAQSVYTPKADSAERKAILAALRVPVEKDFKQKIVFVVDALNSNGKWAYVGGSPQKPGGGNPDLAGTMFAEYEDAYDGNFFGLLRKTGAKWRVVHMRSAAPTFAGSTGIRSLRHRRQYFQSPKMIDETAGHPLA